MSSASLRITDHPAGARLELSVTPRCRQERFELGADGGLRLRVRSAPERGAANRRCLELLAEALGVSRSMLRLLAGHGARRKLIAVEGISAVEIRRRLQQSLARSAQ